MDRLIEDYEKALTEEFERRTTLGYLKERIAAIESKGTYLVITADYKLPQWKAQEYVAANLTVDDDYKTLKNGLADATLAHGKAEIRLAVVTERLELTKARLYGEHHEMLDLREMAEAYSQDVD